MARFETANNLLEKSIRQYDIEFLNNPVEEPLKKIYEAAFYHGMQSFHEFMTEIEKFDDEIAIEEYNGMLKDIANFINDDK